MTKKHYKIISLSITVFALSFTIGQIVLARINNPTATNNTTITVDNIVAESAAATSTFATPTIFTGTTGENSLKVLAGASYGSASLISTDGLFNVTNTSNNDVGLQVYTNNGVNQFDPLVVFRSDNTAFDEGLLYLIQDGTDGGAYNIRMDGPAPQQEWVETDQVAPAGKFETGVNADLYYIAGRNSGDSSFENAFTFERLSDGGSFIQLGTGNVGFGTSTPQQKLHVFDNGPATTTVEFGDISSSTAKTCFNVNATDGSAASFYFNTSGIVFETNACR